MVQSRRFASAKSSDALAFCSGVSEARNLSAASAIAAAERIRATPSMTDQVTSDNAMAQDKSNAVNFNAFIFGLRAKYEFQDLRLETRQIYDGLRRKSILLSGFISLIVSARRSIKKSL